MNDGLSDNNFVFQRSQVRLHETSAPVEVVVVELGAG